MHDYNELYHHGVKGMKWGVRKKTYSDKEISDYRKRKIAESPSKSESPRGANKGWYKNAPKSTIVRQMRTEEKMLIKNEKALNKIGSGKKKAKKAIQKLGSKTIKSSAHAIKTGMSIAQVMYKNPLAENAKQTADYVDLASKMSPEYRRRYMYD